MQAATPNPLINLFPLFLIIIIFYYFIIRPQKLSQKEHQRMIQNLNKNDEVVTTGGLHGRIINLREKTLILRIDDNTKVEIDKNCVAYLKK
jgi:preprotein translocase subunit YajC